MLVPSFVFVAELPPIQAALMLEPGAYTSTQLHPGVEEGWDES